MSDDFTQQFFKWAELQNHSREDIAQLLNKRLQTVSNWRSRGIPNSQQIACQALMDKAQQEKQAAIEDLCNKLEFKISRKQFNLWNQAALEHGQIMEDWALENLDAVAEDYFSGKLDLAHYKPEDMDHLSIVAEGNTEYSTHNLPFLGAVAAGQPVEAPRSGETLPTNQHFPEGFFILEINGQSMEPTLMDGDRIICDGNNKFSAPDNKICIISDSQGSSIKRYNRKTNTFTSDNPEYPSIPATPELRYQASFIEKYTL